MKTQSGRQAQPPLPPELRSRAGRLMRKSMAIFLLICAAFALIYYFYFTSPSYFGSDSLWIKLAAGGIALVIALLASGLIFYILRPGFEGIVIRVEDAFEGDRLLRGGSEKHFGGTKNIGEYEYKIYVYTGDEGKLDLDNISIKKRGDIKQLRHKLSEELYFSLEDYYKPGDRVVKYRVPPFALNLTRRPDRVGCLFCGCGVKAYDAERGFCTDCYAPLCPDPYGTYDAGNSGGENGETDSSETNETEQ